MNRKNRTVAVIDLGSQTFRMAVALCSGSNIEVQASILENVRLGQGLSETGRLSDTAITRGIETLERFMRILKDLAVRNNTPTEGITITAAGTAALRRAENSEIFIKQAAETGVEIEILSARQEADVAAQGVLHTLKHSRACGFISKPGEHAENPHVAIIDVGGGSTEISICGPEGMRQWLSMDIGAVRLTEKFIPDTSGPLEPGVLNAMIKYIDHKLESGLGENFHAACCKCLAGSGGTVTTAAAMELAMTHYDPSRLRGLQLTKHSFDNWIKRLYSMTNAEKGSISGLEPERSDIIIAGMVTVRRIMGKLGFSALVTSDGGLLLGLLIRAIKKECTSYAESSCSGGLYV